MVCVAAKLIDAIDLLLPQTQCERCGFPGCRPYAEAVASGGAPINRCPPGGTATIEALATLLGRDVTPLDPDLYPIDPNAVALIEESHCIGCGLCLPACPVDAIVGAAGYTHSVIARQCTGCELCIVACPVDCIAMVKTANTSQRTSPSGRTEADAARANAARRRFAAHRRRLADRAGAAEARRRQRRTRDTSPRHWQQNWDDA